MKPFKTIRVADAQQLILADKPLILDCRDLQAYRAGHIDNALHVHGHLKTSLLKQCDKIRPILIYCHHGHSSEYVAAMFCDFGFKQIYSLAGGYADWQAS